MSTTPTPERPRSRRPLVVALAATGVVAIAGLTLAACALVAQQPHAAADDLHDRTHHHASPAPTPEVAPAAPAICDTAELRGSVAAGSGGSAGSTGIDLALQNTGASTCTLQGWAGVSFVGDHDGTQLGAPAVQDRETYSHATVTLRPGATGYIPLEIADARDYSADECAAVEADGFRVYPPGSRESLFIAYPVTACTAGPSLLTVSAVQAVAR